MLRIKELLIVLSIAWVVFKVARPVALRFTSESDYVRRRNAWTVLTIAGFLCPNFWFFAAIAIPVLVISGRKDSNPASLYLLLLQVIPPITVTIPMVGISHLFDIDNYLLLALTVMVPAAWRLRRDTNRTGIRGLRSMDFLLLAYGVLTAVLYLHPEVARGVVNASTFTDTGRRAFIFFAGTYIPYFVISRSLSSRRLVVEDMAAFCLMCALMAAIALFESASHWLLYGDMAAHWGHAVGFTMYYLRGQSIRAMASSGHPLVLGYLLGIAFGFWLYLQSCLDSTRYRISVAALLLVALMLTYSRGPLIATAGTFLVFYAGKSRSTSALLKALAGAAIVALVVSWTPLGEKVVDTLPFLGGSIGSYSVDYRHELWIRTLHIVQQSPVLGDQDALLKMQDLRQGEGIIDLVNSYAGILLGNGIVGLSLFLSFFLSGMYQAFAASRRNRVLDSNFSAIGASLVSCMIGTLIMMADGSFGGGLERTFYVLAALAAGYAYIDRSPRQLGGIPSRSGN